MTGIDYTSPETVRATYQPHPVDHEAIVVGAGFGGMAAAIKFTQLGIEDFVILERGSEVGGTWQANRYPGVAVDIASPTYSYSFAPNADWSRLYAPGAELKDYADRIADTYRLRERTRFDSTVTGSRWDDANQLWNVDLAGAPSVTCRYLVIASGLLSQPKIPDLPGLSDFAGTVMHTSNWDEGHDLTGERVAIIGTGATAVQVLPEIAPIVDQLHVFQRTPIWVTPKPDVAIPTPVRSLFRRLPITQRAVRHVNAAAIEMIALAFVAYRQAPWGITAMETVSKAHLRAQVRDPDVRAALTPDYNFWCKRPTFSNTYYPTFNRDNVELVTTGIDHVAANGIVTEDRHKREIDTLILATGFTMQEPGNYPAFPVLGRDGVDMAAWYSEHGYESYEGITVAGFPNLFFLSGPFSFTGLSFFYQAESQMAHMHRLITEQRRRHAVTFEVKRHAQDRFVAAMDRLAGNTVWQRGNCATSNSYYFNVHGQNRMGRLMPTLQAMWHDRHFPLADYRFEPIADVLTGQPTADDGERAGHDHSISPRL